MPADKAHSGRIRGNYRQRMVLMRAMDSALDIRHDCQSRSNSITSWRKEMTKTIGGRYDG